MEYYLAIKKNKIMPLAATWVDLEIVTLSEVSQTKGEISYNILYMWNLKKNDINELMKQTHKLRIILWLLGGRERDSWGVWVGHVHTAVFMDNQQGPTI